MELYNTTGLNGFKDWWNRNKKWVKSVLKGAGRLAGVDDELVDGALLIADTAITYERNDYFGSDGTNEIGPGVDTSLNGVSNYEPTQSEEVILKTFLETKLSVFAASLYKDTQDVLALNNFNEQVKQLEVLINKSEVVSQYYLTNETEGLSPQAIELRNELINYVFISLDGIIDIISTRNNVLLKKQTVRKIVKNLPNDYYPIVFTPSNAYNTRKKFVFYISKLNVVETGNNVQNKTVTKSLYE